MLTARVAVGVGCLALLCVVFIHLRDRASVPNPFANADALEHELRIGLPLGSSLSMVENFLGKRGIEFRFDESSKSVYAVARKLEGHATFGSESLALRFYFDDASKLKSLDASATLEHRWDDGLRKR